MHFSTYLVLLLILFCSRVSAQPEVIHRPELEKILHPADDTLYIINFWATWCKPCVEELPAFIEAARTLEKEKVRFLFVSLDFKKDYESRFLPFVSSRLSGQRVFLLDEPDYDSWINSVSPEWQGAIPATLFLRAVPPCFRFHETLLSSSDLNHILQSLISPGK